MFYKLLRKSKQRFSKALKHTFNLTGLPTSLAEAGHRASGRQGGLTSHLYHCSFSPISKHQSAAEEGFHHGGTCVSMCQHQLPNFYEAVRFLLLASHQAS